MSVRTVSIIECDVHAGNTEATTSRTFTVQGREFEIDLCDEAATEFDEAMEVWIGFARQTGGRRKPVQRYEGGKTEAVAVAVAPVAKAKAKSKKKNGNSDAAAIRAWAKGRRGVDAGTTGRVPQKARDAYYAAQEKDAAATA